VSEGVCECCCDICVRSLGQLTKLRYTKGLLLTNRKCGLEFELGKNVHFSIEIFHLMTLVTGDDI